MSTTPSDFNAVTNSCCALIVQGIPMDKQAVSKRLPIGTLDALTSAENKAGFNVIDMNGKDRPNETDLNPSGEVIGSFRQVYTEGIIPICDQDTDADDVCANPASSEEVPASNYAYQKHTIDMSIKRELVLNINGFKKFCKNPQQFMSDWIAANMFGVKQEMNLKLIQKLVSMMGEYANGDDSVATPHTLNIVNPTATGDKINTMAFALIAQEFEKLGASTQPIMVGGGLFALTDLAKQYFTGTDNSGQQFGKIPNLYHDYAIDTDFGDSDQHILSWEPGVFQIATYNDINNDLIDLSVPNHRERTRILSPFGDGFEWDVYVDVTNNGCRYVIKWQLWFDVIQPVVYSDCIKKPALHWLIDCGPNTCTTLGGPVSLG